VQELGIIITIALSAFFSGAETVFLSFKKVKLPAWLREKAPGSPYIERFIERPERFLVTTLTCNNIVNVIYSSLIVLYLTGHGFSEQVTLILAPVLLMIFGEAAPKSLARQLADRLALRTGFWLACIRWGLYPVVRPVEKVVSGIQKRLNLSDDDMGRMLSRAEIKAALIEAHRGDNVPAASKPLLRGMLAFEEHRVWDIMTPRNVVVMIDVNTAPEEVRRIMLESGFSRLPCFAKDFDDVVGMIHAKDILTTTGSIRNSIRPLKMVPESVTLVELLRWFRQEGVSFAGVVDEYGGFAGVVSPEDLIEEMVGPIDDEFDRGEGIWRMSDRVWLLNGRVRLSHITLLTGFEPVTDRATLGGYVIQLAEGIPAVGSEFETSGAKLRVIKADRRSVKMVRLTLTDQLEDGK